MPSVLKGFGLLAILALMLAILGWTEYGVSEDNWDLGFAIAFTLLGVLGIWLQIKENRAQQDIAESQDHEI